MGGGEGDVWEGPASGLLACLYRASSCSKGMLASFSRSASSDACKDTVSEYNSRLARLFENTIQGLLGGFQDFASGHSPQVAKWFGMAQLLIGTIV